MDKPRILLVDDDPKISTLVEFFLKKANRFEVRVENRSAQALAVAREFLPTVVFLDVDMPGKDGGEVAAEIQREPALKGTHIVFLTSLLAREEAGKQEVRRGGMLYLPKPVDPKALIDTIDRLLAGTITEI